MAGTFRIGDRVVEPQLNSITARGNTIRVEPKMMQVLVCLAQHASEVVSKEHLIRTVWTDTFVSDDVLTRSISELRRVFGDDSKDPRFIQTIPKSGYRLIAPVYFEHTKQKMASSDIVGSGVIPVVSPRLGSPNTRVLVACFALVVMTALAFFLWRRKTSEAPDGGKPMTSIAVLPFKSVGPDIGDAALGLEMADTLITRLSGTKQLVVRPLGAVRKYSDKNQDPILAGRELLVELVLDASTQMEGDRVRVTVRLLKVADGSALWAEPYDEKFEDIFAVQDSVTEKVARALALNLTEAERKLLTKRHMENTDAYRLYLMGRYFENKGTEEGYNKGIQYFNQALQIDPRNALACSGLADTYNRAAQDSILSPNEGFLKAKEFALKALEIDTSLAEAHHSLGCVKWIFEYDWRGTETEYKRGLELDPYYQPNRVCYAEYLSGLGRHDEAFAQMRSAPEPDPTDVFCNLAVGELFYFARQYSRAIEQLQNTLDMEPNRASAHFYLGLAYEQTGMYEKAISELQKANALIQRASASAAALGHAYAVSGNKRKARELIDDLRERAKRRYVAPHLIATIYAGLGEKERAFEWLEREFDDRSGGFTHIKVDPRFDPLRSDPRFGDLLVRAGLPW
ncbi:MAG TPA: winged helix-turn-helix domain-containing protein [Blastocatellia bacterium]|nr:winged helix-turn-helix domain-containing protein [Blastocatellia bacterium]